MTAPQFWIVAAAFGRETEGRLMIGTSLGCSEVEAATAAVSLFLQGTGCKLPLQAVGTRCFTRDELLQAVGDIDAAVAAADAASPTVIQLAPRATTEPQESA